jgi:hypothetical protein
MEALMPDQAIPDFPGRVQRAVVDAEMLAVELSSQTGSTVDVVSSKEYQELVRLKVVLEVETSRTLSETARISAELEQSDLADKLAQAEVDQ